MEIKIVTEDDWGATDSAQFDTLMKAFQIFVTKNAKYHDLWKESPEFQLTGLVQHKLDRIKSLGIAATEEDALDMINYLVFLVRSHRGV